MKRRLCVTSIAPKAERRSALPARAWIAVAGILGLAVLVLSL